MPDTPVVVRYADDLVVLCHSRDQAHQVKTRISEWLTPRGLRFNEDKTRIVHLGEGVDFLGFNIRRYGVKLLIKPSKAATKRLRERLRTEMRSLHGANAGAVLRRINPIVCGWAVYYRTVVSRRTFNAMDAYMWRLTYKWASYSHPNKPKCWVVARYFGMFNPSRKDRWVFGDRTNGSHMPKFGWTGIVRHQMVKGTASPDDPALADYWAERRRRGPLHSLGTPARRWLLAQGLRCPLCGDLLVHADVQPQTPVKESCGCGTPGARCVS